MKMQGEKLWLFCHFSLQKYVREQMLLAVAVIVKRGTLDKTVSCKSIFLEVGQLIGSGNPNVVKTLAPPDAVHRSRWPVGGGATWAFDCAAAANAGVLHPDGAAQRVLQLQQDQQHRAEHGVPRKLQTPLSGACLALIQNEKYTFIYRATSKNQPRQEQIAAQRSHIVLN